MQLQFVALEIDFPEKTALTSSWVEQSIMPMGQPLRWSIAAVNQGRCLVEAVLLKPNNLPAD